MRPPPRRGQRSQRWVTGEAALDAVLPARLAGGGLVVVLTGAGVSAESGIPTFRGQDGYWTVGSRNYMAQDLATAATFAREPDAVWGWYLMRRGLCRAAQPNPAHLALVELERALGDRFRLITQNVDGLHLRAGQSEARTLRVHGDLHFMRCARGCGEPCRVPEALPARPLGEPLQEAERDLLTCARCRGWMRPHVLWFDETYDEHWYRATSASEAAANAAILVIVGTTGATSLPQAVALDAARAGAFCIDIDPEDNVFAKFVTAVGGVHVRGTAVEQVPTLVARCIAALG